MIKQWILILGLFLIDLPCNAQSPSTGSTRERISNYLEALSKAGFSGTVMVSVNDTLLVDQGYGYCNRNRQLRNAPQTIFDIGSITKQFTSAAILKLEMQHRLSTDDLITKYFADVPDDKKSITLHDLLRHQSGLISNVGKDFEPITRDEFLKKVLQSTLKFPPATRFSYSNIGYSLLAMIVEQVSGMTYEMYLYENLWKPAGMEMTGYTRPAFDTNQIAVGYYQNDSVWGKPTDKPWDTDAPYWHLKGNGGILSTSHDLFAWDQAIKKDYILSRAAKQKWVHPKLREGESADAIYAYGWDVSQTPRNTTRIWHNGSNRIFYADFMRYTDEGTTLILLSNKSHPVFNDINAELSRMIFNPHYTPEVPDPDTEENRHFTYRIISVIETQGLEQAKELYKKKSPAESLLEFLMRNEGFDHIDNQQPDIAMQIFKMNAWVHPQSAKALQGLGEGYMETGNKEEALKNFRESLAIQPDNPFVTDMIKRLEKQ